MKKLLALVCTLALLAGTVAVGLTLPALATESPAVGWVADFRESNDGAWMSDTHKYFNDASKGTLYTGKQMAAPTNVSADGISATLQAKVKDVAMVGTSVEADFSVYNKLVIKGTYTGDWEAFRASAHNGDHVTSNWRSGESTVAVPIKDNITLGGDGTFFAVIDVSAFASEDHMWVTVGFYLNRQSALDVDYMILANEGVTDEATATEALLAYLPADDSTVPQPPAAEDVGWEANFLQENNDAWASDTHQNVNGDFYGKLWDSPMMQNPTNVSEDGRSATLQAKHNGVAMVGAKVSVDFYRYNKLYIRGTYTGDINALRFSVHNGEYVTSNWGPTTGNGYSADVNVAVASVIGSALKLDGSFVVEIDLSALYAEESIWVTMGWFLNTSATLHIDYMALAVGTEVKDWETPAPNGQVGWVANFFPSNNDAWSSDPHQNVNGQWNGKLYGSALFNDPTNVSDDGLSATLQAKIGDFYLLLGTKVSADFETYDRVVIKGTYKGNFTAFRGGIHDGPYVSSNCGPNAGNPYYANYGLGWSDEIVLNEDGSFFAVVDLKSRYAGDLALSESIWLNFGWFCDNASTLHMDYLMLTTDTIADEADAEAALQRYMAGEAYVPDSNATTTTKPTTTTTKPTTTTTTTTPGGDDDFNYDDAPSDYIWLDANMKRPVTDYAFSFSVVGDTQKVNYHTPEKFPAIYDYILSGLEAKNTQWVFGLGDITDASLRREWDLAYENIHRMDGKVGYSLVRGNHDSISSMNGVFPPSDFADVIDGLFDPKSVFTSYQLFEVGTIKYLMMTLDYGASDEALVWAADVIEQYPDRNVIITTHGYLHSDGTLLDDTKGTPPATTGGYNNGDDMWEKLISQYENIALVLCGHMHNDRIMINQSEGIHGNTVTSLLINPQGADLTYNGLGMVATLYFSDDGKDVTVDYYSTARNQYFMDENQFSFTLDIVGDGRASGGEEDDTTTSTTTTTTTHVDTTTVTTGNTQTTVTTAGSVDKEDNPDTGVDMSALPLIVGATGVLLLAADKFRRRKHET